MVLCEYVIFIQAVDQAVEHFGRREECGCGERKKGEPERKGATEGQFNIDTQRQWGGRRCVNMLLFLFGKLSHCSDSGCRMDKLGRRVSRR
jgi:hypothetical protein